MAIICVSNLKGGVGKTALSVNTAHALAKRSCETLLIDIDPQNAVSHLIGKKNTSSLEHFGQERGERSLAEMCMQQVSEVRNGLYTLSLSALVEKLPMQPGAEEAFVIGNVIQELAVSYDFVVIDTPPVWCGALQAAIECASMVLIPIDPSVMAVEAAIDLLNKAEKRPDTLWMLQRTMVSRQAKRVARVSANRIAERFPVAEASSQADEEKRLPKPVGLKGVNSWGENGLSLFQSEIVIPRSEQVHRLGFMQKSVFDNNDIPALQQAYADIARQIESLLASLEEEEEQSSEFLDAFAL